MSGPKTATYVVLNNHELKRRALEAARKVAEDVIHRVKAIRTELSGLSLDIAEIDLDAATCADIERWTIATTSAVAEAEEAIAARRCRWETERMVAAIAGPRADAEGKKATTSRPAAASESRRMDSWRERIASRVEATIESAPLLSEADLVAILGLARAATSARTESSAALFTDELRVRVHQFTEIAAERRRATVDATRLLTTLNGLEGGEVESVRSALRAVQQGEQALTGALRSRTHAAATAARRDADRRYTADVLAEALADLGYEVEEGFATLIAGQRDGQAARWADHAVRVRFAGPNEVTVRVVREQLNDPSEDQLREDAEVEHEFCRDFARLAAQLESRHVQVRITSQVLPGEEVVAAVDRLRARRSGDAPRARARSMAPRRST